jgi:DNA-binding GntR family transcriptional regulator
MPMSIADFHQKFVSATENNVLVESLRRLSLLEDPKVMFEGDPMNEWSYWSEAPSQA